MGQPHWLPLLSSIWRDNKNSMMRYAGNQMKRLMADRTLFLVVILILVFLVLFVLFPLFKVIQNGIFYKGELNLQYFRAFFSGQHSFVTPFFNSLIVGSIVAVTSTVIGFIFAYVTTRTNIPGRRVFRIIGIIPIVTPPFIMSLAVIMLLGRNGPISTLAYQLFGVSWNIYGLPGLVLTETFAFFAMAFLILEAVLGGISPSLEEAAHDLGASRLRTFVKVTLPLALPGIAGALLLTFARSLEDFGDPIIIQGRFPVLTTQIYLAITGTYNIPLGATLALILLVPTVLVFILQRYVLSRRSYVSVTGKPSSSKVAELPAIAKWGLFGAVALCSAWILLLYATIIFGSFTKLWGINWTFTLEHYKYAFTVGWRYLKDSLLLATIATMIGGIWGMIIAYVVATKKIVGRGIIDFLATVNFAVPGIVIGIGYIFAFNTRPLLLTGTAAIIILVFISQRTPAVVRDGVAMLQQIDPVIDEAAADLGAGFFTTFTKVILPLTAPALVAGMAYMFAACITSISAVIMVVSADWYLITVALLSEVDLGALSTAAVYGVMILVSVTTVILLMDVVVSRILLGRRG